MKFSKKHIFFPITVLITGLATMPTYPVNGSSSEEIFVDAPEVLPVQPGTSQVVPQSVISQLSFSAQNAFRKGERVAIKSDTQPGKYEYRIVENVGRAIDRSNPQIEEPFREGKSVRARFFRLSDEPITRARKPEELGKLPGQEPAKPVVTPSAPVEQVQRTEYKAGTIVTPEVDTQLSFSDAHLFRRGEIVAVESAQYPGKYEYRPITFAEEIEPGFDMESFSQNLPIKAGSFGILIGNRMHHFPPQKIGKITAYKIGEIVPDWVEKLESLAFDEKNTTIPNGEMVMVRRSDGTLRFGRVEYKEDRRGDGNIYYTVLVDRQTGATKTMPAKQVGRITHYL